MLSSHFLDAGGPTLIAIEGAVALLFVHRKLSRVPHALAWALAFVAFAVQFLLVGGAATMLGVVGALLFVEGFHIRATGKAPTARRLVIGGLILAVTAASLQVGYAEILPRLIGGALLAYAIRQVVPRHRRPTSAELAVLAMLAAMAALQIGLGVMALLDVARAWREGLADAAPLPMIAASCLFAMLLIASDFSGELLRVLYTDPLTGVLNRAGFEQAARETLDRAGAWSQPVSVAIADIDRFKAINDRHGHAIGDCALSCVAGHLTTVAGEDDLVGRIGGEEFAMLLWNADAMTAHRRIDDARASLPSTCTKVHAELQVTISVGIAQRAGAEALPLLLDRADRALYRSKREGRDRTTLANVSA